MAPVRKEKHTKTFKVSAKKEKQKLSIDESVVSGQLQKKINKKQQKPQTDPKGVVFIKHLPHGFFEEQLKKYFEQFGEVTRVRLARSKRTGKSKGYAFVEFEYPEVAEVAAETMDNYLMFKQIVKASYIPPEKQQFNYFRTSVKQIRNKSGKLVWVSGKTASIQKRLKKQNDWSEEKYQKRTQKQLGKLKKIGEKYAHLGIDIDEIVLQPKILTQKKISEKAEKNNEKFGTNTKAEKRKPTKQNIIPNKQEGSKKLKHETSFEDLLGNTIQEDSEDEDYIPMADSDDNAGETDVSSDEESYDFGKFSDEEDDNEQNESEDEASHILQKKIKKGSFGKKLKASNVERLDEMLKRKPHTGGINKITKKTPKQPLVVVPKNKKALQIAAAKEVAKPLSTVKGKLIKKSKKNLVKVK